MRLILLDISKERRNFHPLAFGRPVWELRCGIGTLLDKLTAAVKSSGAALPANEVAAFVPPYLADCYRQESGMTVNDPASLECNDLLLLDGRVKADHVAAIASGPSVAAFDESGQLLYARIRPQQANAAAKSLLEWARNLQRDLASSASDAGLAPALQLPGIERTAKRPATWNYAWELVAANPDEITRDFERLGACGVEGLLESPSLIRGSERSVFIAPGAVVQSMAVIDAQGGPVYIDEGAQIHPFSRIEGPCYIGKDTLMLGAKCRAGNSIGPVCRIGGEIEASIIQGYSNKYHDGFLGHAYVGQWVNIGAMGSNSDLRNDYGPVEVKLDERGLISTGSTKFGCLIGDHAKTSIGMLLNTGSYVGVFALLVTSGPLLPKHIPSFCSYLKQGICEKFTREQLYATAKTVLSRRGQSWTPEMQTMWDAVYEMTAPQRKAAIG